jgi:hypothetical protein
MNPTLYAARVGLGRGWTEFRHYLTNPQDLAWNVFVVTAFVVVLLFQRNTRVEGSALPLAMLTLPGILGMWVAIGGYQGAGGALAVEREDGTLLRAKAVPQGMVGYLVGRTVSVSLAIVFTLVIIFVAGLVLLPELAAAGRSGWPTLLWVVVLGLLATLPWGAVIGSLVKSPNSAFGLPCCPPWCSPPSRGSSTRSPRFPGGCRGSRRPSPSTGSASASGRACCRTPPPPWRSRGRGGTWRPPLCSARGRWRAC